MGLLKRRGCGASTNYQQATRRESYPKRSFQHLAPPIPVVPRSSSARSRSRSCGGTPQRKSRCVRSAKPSICPSIGDESASTRVGHRREQKKKKKKKCGRVRWKAGRYVQRVVKRGKNRFLGQKKKMGGGRHFTYSHGAPWTPSRRRMIPPRGARRRCLPRRRPRRPARATSWAAPARCRGIRP